MATRPNLKPRKTRLKTGCGCCRLRKKKCDEMRPVCLTCQRLNLRCSWPGENEFTWRINLGLSSSKRTSRKSKGHRASRTEDGGSSEDNETFALSQSSSVEPVLAYALLPSLPSEMGKLDNPSRRLLELFIRRTAHQILGTPSVVQNPFLHHLVPIALSDRLIMNALLSVGGYPLLGSGGGEIIERKRLHCYVDALRDLKAATAEWSSGRGGDAVRLLLTTFLLCLHEVSDLVEAGSSRHRDFGARNNPHIYIGGYQTQY